MKKESSFIAYIKAQECIGCTKCIQACPVDAILGASKQLHTVLKECCIGCKLCVAPCPVDCIEMQPVDNLICEPTQARERVRFRKERLKKETNFLHRENDAKAHSTAYLKSVLDRSCIVDRKNH